MSTTTKNYVDATLGLTQTFWSPVFEKEMRENTLWTGLLQDPNYTMEKVKGGDTFKISKINKPTSTIKTVGVDADSFESNVLNTTQIDLVANKRCVSAYKFEDLAILMSQLEQENSEIRESLLADVREQANDWIKSLISPSTSAPAHVLTSVSDFNLTQLSAVRTLSANAKWRASGQPWYLLASPDYYSNMLDDTTLSASNVMGIGVSPIVQGFFNFNRMGYTIIEDDSLSNSTAYAMIPSFMKIVLGQPRFMISDLHALGQFGFQLSVDFVLGATMADDTRVISIAN